MNDTPASESMPPLSDEEVRAFLEANPDFLDRNPDLLAKLAEPEKDLGNGVVNFQHFAIKNLQKNSSDLKSKYFGLVDFCRDNLSIQSQVHDAVLRLVEANSLEQLLEVVTLDLVTLFDVDVVRLAVESEAAEFYETYYSEENYSGIVFIPHGTSEVLLNGKKALLCDDAHLHELPGFEDIFADCAGLINSFALLRLEMRQIDREVLLAFGVRYKERFNEGQGIELLAFLARIVAHQLDVYLSDLSA